MKINKLSGIEGAKQSQGTVVIIDVFRAATVAAFLLDKGITEIVTVSTKEEAFAHKIQNPQSLLVGEEHGYKIDGFDLGNSPYEVSQLQALTHPTAIHRSSSGTQGIVHAQNADQIIFGSFVTAEAIYNYLNQTNPKVVSVVPMEGGQGEDELFADYLISLLTNTPTLNISQIKSQLKAHPSANRFLDPKLPEFPEEDFHLSLDLNRFNFVPLMKNGKIIKHQL